MTSGGAIDIESVMDAYNYTTSGTVELATASAAANYSYDKLISNETAISCEPLDTANTTVYAIFSLLVPNDDGNWAPRTSVYWAFFYIMVVVFGLLNLCLALGCILLLAKRHLAQRFRVRTFIAIDVALMVLGFSRVLFFVGDPWGQSGFCANYACVVVSRLIGGLAFPSLTASYTLVLITLWSSARMQLGRSCIQRLKVLIPLCFVHYGVAIVFEIVGSVPTGNNMVVIVLLVACESTFSIWGFLVCFSFLISGHRLLKSIEKSARSSSVMCKDSPNITRHQLIEKSKFQNQVKDGRKRSHSTLKLKHMLREKHQRALRKVSLITYITVLLGMLYSVVNFVNLILTCLSLFYGCAGYLDFSIQLHPGLWLALRYVTFVLELFLAVLLTYSISDYQPILNLLCCGMRKVGSRQPSPTSGLESTTVTIESDGATRHCPSLSRGPSPTPPVDTTDNDVSIPDSSNVQIKFPTLTNSPPATGSPKRVKIFEYNSSMMVSGSSKLASTSSLNNHTKITSPLTVSHSSSDATAVST